LAPAAMLCIFASFVLLPLAEAITIGFAAPIVMAVLGVFLLGERVGWRRWAAILAGFGGVLIVVRPDGLSLSIGAGLALGGTLIYSLSMVWGRRLMRRDGAMTLALYTHLVAIVVLAAVLPWNWVTPTLPDLALMAVMGIAGGFAALFLTRGYQLGPVAVLGPFDYLNLPVAAFSGWLIWQEIPGTHVWWGAAVIVGSGLYIVHRERQAKAGGGGAG
ncbi:MAG: DMT family transporter, partial [Caenispirillum bisanense]|nr:DMT family transporter [Caenispirillum bisanense]